MSIKLRYKSHHHVSLNRAVTVMLLVLTFVGGSVYAAANLYSANEPELATVSSASLIKNDTSASGGKVVRFGTTTYISNVKIMTLGDSITAGDSAPNVPQAYRQDLKTAMNNAGYTVTFVGDMNDGVFNHESLGGACIGPNPATPSDWGNDCYSINLYPSTAGWISTFQPNIVIMGAGNNDFCCGNHTNYPNNQQIVSSSLRNWIDLVYATKPDVKIIVLGMPGWRDNYFANSIPQIVSDNAAAGRPIGYIAYDGISTADGTHPNAQGYQQMTDRIVPVITPFMQQLTGH